MTPIILIAISIAGMIGLFILYYRRIHLFMISIFCGKYSINYYNKFRSYYYRSPFPSSVKDDFYSQMYGFTENHNMLRISTSREIKFTDVPFSTSFKVLLRKKGTPNYYTALKVADSVVDIFGYKDTAYKYDLRVLYYFWNRTFFMGVLEFRELSHNNKQQIISELKEKYLISEDLSGKDCCITDNNDTSILVQDVGFALWLKYFHRGNSQIVVGLNEYMKDMSLSETKLKDTLEQANTKLPL